MQISLQETTWKWVVGGLHAAARGATCGQGDVWGRSKYISFTRTFHVQYSNNEKIKEFGQYFEQIPKFPQHFIFVDFQQRPRVWLELEFLPWNTNKHSILNDIEKIEFSIMIKHQK